MRGPRQPRPSWRAASRDRREPDASRGATCCSVARKFGKIAVGFRDKMTRNLRADQRAVARFASEMAARRVAPSPSRLLLDLCRGRFGPSDVVCPICGPTKQKSASRTRPVLRIWLKEGLATFNCARCCAHGYAHAKGAKSTKPASAPRRNRPEATSGLELQQTCEPASGLGDATVPVPADGAELHFSRRSNPHGHCSQDELPKKILRDRRRSS